VSKTKANTVWFRPWGFSSAITKLAPYEVHYVAGQPGFFSGFGKAKTPMLMIHGAVASRRYLLPTAKLLANHMKVYVLDLPGHGASSKPDHVLSAKEQAEVVSRFIDAHKLKRIYVYANSYGCQIAANLAAKRSNIIKGMILTGPTTDPKAATILQQGFRLWLDGFVEPKSARPQLILDLLDQGIVRGIKTGEEMLIDDIRVNLPKIKCPTLVLRGEKDPIAPQQWVKQVAHLIPKSKFGVIKNGSHSVNYAAAKQLTKSILEFISKLK
jgi:2-hydroxy-6-oxonona-2,4-dienedioate hydrolase